MDDLNRRKFLSTAAGIGASWAAPVSADEDQADVARSRQVPLGDADAPLDRDRFGLRGGKPLTPETVRLAIESGIQFLKSLQKPTGAWTEQWHYDRGLTPLCTLALLNAGCNAGDPAIALALKYLRDLVPRSTYTTSLQTMVFCQAEPEKDRPLIQRNVAWLESRQFKDGIKRGMWAIPSVHSTDHTDNSMSHFAILALNEAERVGVSVNRQVWSMALEHWQNTQNDDGSWGWGPTYPGSGSMTCAGIAALIIAGGALNPGDAAVVDGKVQGCATQLADPYMDRAVAWLAHFFSVLRNPGTEFWYSYYMYALERAGRMSAQRFFGQHDWYREGTAALVRSQEYSGAWPADLEFKKIGDKAVSTSFSLMFLAKGRWPVVVAHLKRKPASDWNRHRSALANLLGHVERTWGRNLTHQVVDIELASVEELCEVPVLYFGGHDRPQFSPDEKQKLRDYIDRGGFIFAERCCGGEEFDIGFRELMRDLFPDSGNELQPLPPDHPVWTIEEAVQPDLPVWGIDLGCRTAVIYCPFDVSSYWELDRVGRENPDLVGVHDALVTARNIGLNVLGYATGREVSFKNPSLPVASTNSFDQGAARGAILIANVAHAGGSHAAPGALRALLRRASNEFRLHLNPEPVEITLNDPNLLKYPVLFFHGRSNFSLSDAERQGLRDHVKRGGTVIADAVCSSSKFAESFRAEMNKTFPDQPLAPVPGNDRLFTPAYGGADIRVVSRRVPRGTTPSNASKGVSQGAPVLEAVTVDDRYAVLFSPYDLSCALETEPVGCSGYTRKDSMLIAMNLLLYSLNQ